MKTRRRTGPHLLFAALAIGAAPLSAQSDDAALGRWSGTLVAGPQELEIVYNVDRADDGSLTGTMDVPTQGATGIPLSTVTFADGTLSMTFAVPGGGSYEGTLDESGNAIAGTFTQAGQAFPLDLVRTEAPPPPARPQEPQAPFPYTIEDVRVDQPDGDFQLAGTLTVPEGDGPFPAAVLVSGSGPQDRDEALMGHRPFWVLADHLSRQGIAVLRYDDRGVGGSGGVFATATSEDFASDALAAIGHLGADPRIDPAAIGIVGHSEGGLVGPMAARGSSAVGFVVMLAGPGVNGLEILVEQGRLINEAAGAPDEITALNGRIQRRLAGIAEADADPTTAAAAMRAAMRAEVEALGPEMREIVEASLTDQAIEQNVAQMNSPWFRFFVGYDPVPALRALDVPVLALFGEKDLQVPPLQSADAVARALGDNRDATVEVLPDLNHLFQEAETGLPTEYQAIEQTMSPVALTAISEWILARFGG